MVSRVPISPCKMWAFFAWFWASVLIYHSPISSDRQPAVSVSVICQNSTAPQSIMWLPIPAFCRWKWRNATIGRGDAGRISKAGAVTGWALLAYSKIGKKKKKKYNWGYWASPAPLPPTPLALFVGQSVMRRSLAACLSLLYNKINDS